MLKALLVSDEDFINTKYMINKLKKNKGIFEMSWEECLTHHGTVAYLGSIPRKYLVSFTIIRDSNYIEKYVENKRIDYVLDYNQLQEGKGKGKRVHWMEMIKRETTSNRNMTWFMKDIDVNARIKDIIYDEIFDMLRCVLVTPEKGASLYDIRTSMDKDMERIINSKKELLIPGVPAK